LGELLGLAHKQCRNGLNSRKGFKKMSRADKAKTDEQLNFLTRGLYTRRSKGPQLVNIDVLDRSVGGSLEKISIITVSYFR